MRRIALVLAFGLGCAGAGPTGPDLDAQAAGPCYGLLIEDTLFINTHRPMMPTGLRLARPAQQRRGIQWRSRRLPTAVDTIILQAWVQMCPP
jgi:hypothetical protein